MIELRLGGKRTQVPGLIVEPLLITDLPTFCRWRGLPPWGEPELEQLVNVCDRLVVDSSEWRGLPGVYDEASRSSSTGSPSRTSPGAGAVGWRGRLAAQWPQIRKPLEKLSVTGPKADALLLAGWLRSRLHKPVQLSHRAAAELERVAVDGEPVAPAAGRAAEP